LVQETQFSRWSSNDNFEKGESEYQGLAVGYIYRCIGMNEALECSPNYPHTRLSTTTRSHVRDSDFRLVAKEVKEFDKIDVNCVFESSVERIAGREQKEAQTFLERLERRPLRPKKSTAGIPQSVEWLRLDFRFVAQQISVADTSEAHQGICEPTLSVRPSQRGYKLVIKKRVLLAWVSTRRRPLHVYHQEG
jgi:hypothetical protein